MEPGATPFARIRLGARLTAWVAVYWMSAALTAP
jgi:hypothetical protein